MTTIDKLTEIRLMKDEFHIKLGDFPDAIEAVTAWALEIVGPKGSYLAMDDLHKDAYKAQYLLKEHIRAKLTGGTK